ncbi:MAG: hypothetical protein M9904_06075 [Chitinophagaceae bacterium]|nr:hypothetical protein [Chitinophagaceae bacterium]
MKIKWLPLLCIAAWISSCTKEVSVEQDDSQRVTDTTPLAENGGLIKRLVSRYEGEEDSMVINFIYDSNSRITEIKGVKEGVATADDQLYSFLEKFQRNEKGLVDKIKVETYLYYSGFNDPQLHWTENFDLHYNNETSMYKYALTTGTGESDPISDSIAYVYGSDGRIKTVAIYDLENNMAELGDKFEYEYSTEGNITNRKASMTRNSDREDWFTNRFEYDEKINPMNFGQEILLIGDFMVSMPTANNVTVCDDAILPEDGYTVQYTYNNYNKPTSAIWHYNSGEKMTLKYYYLK